MRLQKERCTENVRNLMVRILRSYQRSVAQILPQVVYEMILGAEMPPRVRKLHHLLGAKSKGRWRLAAPQQQLLGTEEGALSFSPWRGHLSQIWETIALRLHLWAAAPTFFFSLQLSDPWNNTYLDGAWNTLLYVSFPWLEEAKYHSWKVRQGEDGRYCIDSIVIKYKCTILTIFSVQSSGIKYIIYSVVQPSHYPFPQTFHYPKQKLCTH